MEVLSRTLDWGWRLKIYLPGGFSKTNKNSEELKAPLRQILGSLLSPVPR